MKKLAVVGIAVLVVCMFAAGSFAKEAAKGKSGMQLFAENCSMCHPDGGNIVNGKKTLHKADRDANDVKTPADVIKRMRNPGPGMTKFDVKMVSDADAKKIADYIFATFK